MKNEICAVMLLILVTINLFVNGQNDCTIVYLNNGGTPTTFIYTDASGNHQTNVATLPKTCGGGGYKIGVECNGESFGITVTLLQGATTLDSFSCTGCCVGKAAGTFFYSANTETLSSTTIYSMKAEEGEFNTEKSFITGDPHFIGLLGQHFDMQGTSNKIYNLFSDQHISINGLFSKYNVHTNIISVMSIMFDNHSIIVFANQTSNITTNILFDEEIITLLPDNFLNLTSCVFIGWHKTYIQFETPAHKFYIVPMKNQYINFNFIVDLNENVTGGIIGQTNSENFTSKSLIETDYIEETLTSSLSLKNQFKHSKLCDLQKGLNPVKVSLNHMLDNLPPIVFMNNITVSN